jgi:hypothetical protein
MALGQLGVAHASHAPIVFLAHSLAPGLVRTQKLPVLEVKIFCGPTRYMTLGKSGLRPMHLHLLLLLLNQRGGC